MFCLFTRQEQHLTLPNGDGNHSKRTMLHYLHLFIYLFFQNSKNWVGRTMRNIKISGDVLTKRDKETATIKKFVCERNGKRLTLK